MAKADEQGAVIIRFFVKIFLNVAPLSIVLMGVTSLSYNKWKYGHVDPHQLYRPCRYVYE